MSGQSEYYKPIDQIAYIQRSVLDMANAAMTLDDPTTYIADELTRLRHLFAGTKYQNVCPRCAKNGCHVNCNDRRRSLTGHSYTCAESCLLNHYSETLCAACDEVLTQEFADKHDTEAAE